MQRRALPYAPLPSKASQVATAFLTQLGFDKKAIVEDYKFSSTQNEYIQLNALVFAHSSRCDLEDYASVTMLHAVNGHSDSELVTRLAETSALIHLIHHENGFAVWTSRIQIDTTGKKRIQPIQIKEFIPYDGLGSVIIELREPPLVIQPAPGFHESLINSHFKSHKCLIHTKHMTITGEESVTRDLNV